MKKQTFSGLLAVTGIFLAFTIGLYFGRNTASGNVQITQAVSLPLHADKEPIITTIEETAPEETVVFPLNINSATQAQLMALPGIGETLAQRILDYRTANGAFSRPAELLNVPGIGAGKLEAILDYIVTEGGTA